MLPWKPNISTKLRVKGFVWSQMTIFSLASFENLPPYHFADLSWSFSHFPVHIQSFPLLSFPQKAFPFPIYSYASALPVLKQSGDFVLRCNVKHSTCFSHICYAWCHCFSENSDFPLEMYISIFDWKMSQN